jgi:hypothetical protein
LPGRQVEWPGELPAQFALVRRLLAETGGSAEALSARLAGRGTPKRRAQIQAILETLQALGHG